MAERYERIFTSNGEYYIESSPVIFLAGALLKDTKQNRIVAQLKFRNISRKIIRAVRIQINAKNSFEENVEGILEYSYTDLNANAGNEWGQDVAITMPDVTTRVINIVLKSVVFKDGSIWKNSKNTWTPLSKQNLISEELKDRELIKQFKLEYGEKAQNLYLEEHGIWHCVCGNINLSSDEECFVCKTKKELLASYDLEVLKAKTSERLEEERIKREEAEEKRRIEEERRAEEARIQQHKLEEQKREKEVKRKKVTRVILVVFVLAILSASGVYIANNYVIPNMEYKQAGEALENDSFEEAITIYTELGDYKDSKEKITECRYQQAKWYLESEEYMLAINILREIESYKDSSALIEENIFSYAKKLMANKQYKEAIEIFEANENIYEEARTLRQEASYYYALELSEKENYEEALEYFDKAFKFADTQDKKIEIKYKYACELLENDEPRKALALFENCSGYLDADKKINDAKYRYVILNKDKETKLAYSNETVILFDSVVYEYLKQLKAIGYPNANDLYDEYYKEYYDRIKETESGGMFSAKEKH